ncbi:MAG TPA: protein-L-isoaspartate(D-aspartate) O-methyltransferase [Tepidisphaeraceae bacterium]|nr:protein-L-isoaspartate(D-aspartate) O-methyltransferase [Tepidisphaeraceae bacterium]
MHKLGEVSPQELMLQTQVVERGIRDERILNALRAVPRERFFPPGSRDSVFADRPSPIGHGQTISQPYMVALMSFRLNVAGTHRVLEIGTGSGYQTAILSHLAAEVFTVERVKPLLDEAFERLMGLGIRNVHYRFGDGSLGWPELAPFDRILISAAAPEIPTALLLSQLTEGGQAVLPAGDDERQMLIHVRRRGGELDISDICPCRFVRLVGAQAWDQARE